MLNGGKKFEWRSECKQVFQYLKEHLGKAPILVKPIKEKMLLPYLVVSKVVVSSFLVKEIEKQQLPIYCLSKVLQGAKARYPNMEKLTLILVVASQNLQTYFHSQP